MRIKTIVSIAAAAAALSLGAGVAVAYDGTKCKAAGVCWEPKPGFPEKVAGSKYDPKHDPKELAKQQTAQRKARRKLQENRQVGLRRQEDPVARNGFPRLQCHACKVCSASSPRSPGVQLVPHPLFDIFA